MKDIIINQPAGLGDILFCQKIAHSLTNDGFRVIWPVCDEYLNIAEYVKSPAIFTSTHDALLDDPFMGRVNLRDADQYFPGCMMDAKYKLVNIEWEDWADYLTIQYNHQKSWELFNLLGARLNEPYTVVNKSFGTPPHQQECDHIPEISGRVITMRPVPGYSIFDWWVVLRNAKAIHTVDTSIMFMIEKMELPSTALACYSRFNPPDFRNVTHLFKQHWVYCK